MIKYFIFFLSLLACYNAFSQSLTWEKQFHFDKWTTGYDALETQDSDYLVPSLAGNDSTGAVWLMKLDHKGNYIWKEFIDSPGISCFIKKDNGTYSYIKFTKLKFDSLIYDWLYTYSIVDINSDGNILKEDKINYKGKGYIPNQLLPLDNGNFILQSNLYYDVNEDSARGNSIIQKFNKQGLIWSDTFNFDVLTQVSTMIRTQNNQLVVGGMVSNGKIMGTHIPEKFSFLLFLDSNGKQIKYVPFPYIADSSEQVEYITQLHHGNILVQSAQWGGNPVYFTEFDSKGDSVFRKATSGLPYGIGGFVPDGDSVFIYYAANLLDGPLHLVKMDQDLNPIWDKSYDDTADFQNTAGQMLKTSDGGLLLVGTRQWIGGGNILDYYSDIVVIKLDSQGNLYKPDYSGVRNREAFISDPGQIYPNPAHDHLYIKMPVVAGGGSASLDIYGSSGALVKTYTDINGKITAKDISFLANGLYMYRLYNDKQVYCTGKFIKE